MIGYEFSNLKEFKKLKCFVTDGLDGFSQPPYDSLNLGLHINDKMDSVLKNREKAVDHLGYMLSDLVVMDLVHGSNVEIIENKDKERGSDSIKNAIPETDAMVTNEKDVVLSVFVADCIPAIIYDPENHVIATIHGGWKPLAGNITAKTIDKMVSVFGSNPNKLVVGVGPAVCGKCYDVYENVANEIKEAFPNFAKEVLIKNKGRIYLDIQKLMRLQLEDKGVKNIETSEICTFENKDFYSYRRDKETGRFGIFAVLE